MMVVVLEAATRSARSEFGDDLLGLLDDFAGPAGCAGMTVAICILWSLWVIYLLNKNRILLM